MTVFATVWLWLMLRNQFHTTKPSLPEHQLQID
jgi:hypothetical protein